MTVPQHWRVLPFSEAFAVTSDGGRRVAQHDYLSHGAIPVVDQGQDFIGGYTNDVDLAFQGQLPVFVFGDHTRRIKMVEFPFAVGAQGVKLLHPGVGLSPRFAYLMLQSVRLDDRGYGRHFALLRKEQFAVPPLDEQQRIVDILEDHLSRLDAAQASLTRGASACGVLNLSVLSEIRGSLLESSVKLEALGEVCETALGKMLDAKKASGTPTPYLGNINVRWGGFDLSALKTVPLSDAERARFEVKPGDLLVCEGGEPGRCAVWVDGTTGITYQKALHRVRAKDPSRVTPDYVALLLEEFIRMGRADRMFTGTTIRHLPQEKLRAIEIPIPDLQTQRAMVDRVTAHAQATSRLAHEVRRVAHEGAALRRALLGAAFSGQLTGRTTDLEMVEEMADV